jgi:hypothetical protein
MPELKFEVIPFTAGDGMPLFLQRYITSNPCPKGPVMLVHGAGVRGNLFNPPQSPNLIECLSEAGYDVWLENWRGSIEIPKNKWNLDQVAVNDHPMAVQKICEVTGAKEIKAIIHCQGSTSFTISAMLGLVPQVKTIISNAVSLHPVLPGFARFKIKFVAPMINLVVEYLNPGWGNHAPGFWPKIFSGMVSLTHWEKDTKVGKFVSFTYGAGCPALWELDNMSQETLEWIRYEFANVPMTFFKHIRAGVNNGALVAAEKNNGVRQDYSSTAPKTDARFILFAGKLNKCFRYESQVNTFNWLEKHKPGFHKLHLLENYSHLDVFLGKNAHVDVFPKMIQELDNH